MFSIFLYPIVFGVSYIFFKLNHEMNHNEELSIAEKNIEQVKNALLSYALSVVYPNDYGNNHNYDEYKGDKLPPMIGCDKKHALFTYIQNDEIGYNVMRMKNDAILQFLVNKFEDVEDACDFFSEFVDKMQKKDDKPVTSSSSEYPETTVTESMCKQMNTIDNTITELEKAVESLASKTSSRRVVYTGDEVYNNNTPANDESPKNETCTSGDDYDHISKDETSKKKEQ